MDDHSLKEGTDKLMAILTNSLENMVEVGRHGVSKFDDVSMDIYKGRHNNPIYKKLKGAEEAVINKLKPLDRFHLIDKLRKPISLSDERSDTEHSNYRVEVNGETIYQESANGFVNINEIAELISPELEKEQGEFTVADAFSAKYDPPEYDSPENDPVQFAAELEEQQVQQYEAQQLEQYETQPGNLLQLDVDKITQVVAGKQAARELAEAEAEAEAKVKAEIELQKQVDPEFDAEKTGLIIEGQNAAYELARRQPNFDIENIENIAKVVAWGKADFELTPTETQTEHKPYEQPDLDFEKASLILEGKQAARELIQNWPNFDTIDPEKITQVVAGQQAARDLKLADNEAKAELEAEIHKQIGSEFKDEKLGLIYEGENAARELAQSQPDLDVEKIAQVVAGKQAALDFKLAEIETKTEYKPYEQPDLDVEKVALILEGENAALELAQSQPNLDVEKIAQVVTDKQTAEQTFISKSNTKTSENYQEQSVSEPTNSNTSNSTEKQNSNTAYESFNSDVEELEAAVSNKINAESEQPVSDSANSDTPNSTEKQNSNTAYESLNSNVNELKAAVFNKINQDVKSIKSDRLQSLLKSTFSRLRDGLGKLQKSVSHQLDLAKQKSAAKTFKELFKANLNQTGETTFESSSFNVELKGDNTYQIKDNQGNLKLEFQEKRFSGIKINQSSLSGKDFESINKATKSVNSLGANTVLKQDISGRISLLGSIAPKADHQIRQDLDTNAVAKTAKSFLHYMGVESWKREGGAYEILKSGNNLKILDNASGKEILRLHKGKLSSRLQPKDINFFKKLDSSMSKQVKELRNKQQNLNMASKSTYKHKRFNQQELSR